MFLLEYSSSSTFYNFQSAYPLHICQIYAEAFNFHWHSCKWYYFKFLLNVHFLYRYASNFMFYSFNDSLGLLFKTTLLKYDLYTINLSILNEQSNDF